MSYRNPDDLGRGVAGQMQRRRKPKADPTPKCFTTPEFMEQRKYWYAKLKQDGFQDIERLDDSMKEDYYHNQAGAAERREMRNLSGMSEVAPVYELGEQWINRYVWGTRRDRWHFNCIMSGVRALDVYEKHPIPARGSYQSFLNSMGTVRRAMVAVNKAEVAAAEESDDVE